MNSKGVLLERSMFDWSVRLTLALAAAALGYSSLTHTLGYSIRTRDPERALISAGGDGRVAAAVAQMRTIANATSKNRIVVDRLARQALLDDATAVAAASVLGVNAQVRGNGQEARRWFAYSQRLSRRDLQTQLWYIEDAVSHNDTILAINHYDIALRTSRPVADILFPILSQAIADPVVRSALVNSLVARPNWSETFVEYVSGNGPNPRATASLFRTLRLRGFPVSKGANALLINALIAGGFTNDAWRYYSVLGTKVNPRYSRDPVFAANPTSPTPFDWIPTGEPGMNASMQQSGASGLFDFATSPGSSGLLLQQMQILPPGRYQLKGHSIGLAQPDGSSPYWTLRCREGQELGRIDVTNSAEAQGVFSGFFQVPAGCAVQTLMLMAPVSGGMSGISGQIDRAQISPVL